MASVTFPVFLAQTLNVLVTLVWLSLVWWALRTIRQRCLTDEAKALWAGLIVIIPFLGALAFWVVMPGLPAVQAQPPGHRLLPAPEPWEAVRASGD